jgi:hypothetical protein
MRGFEVCPHTCVRTGCISASTRTPLWRREGGSCTRHTRNTAHVACSRQCPANASGTAHVSRTPRTPTTQELQDFVPKIRHLGTVSDDTLAYILDITQTEVERRYGSVDPHPPVDADMAQDDSDVAEGEDVEMSHADMEEMRECEPTVGPGPWLGKGGGPSTMHLDNIGPSTKSQRGRSVGSSVSGTSAYSYSLMAHSELPEDTTVGTDDVQCFRILYVPDPSRGWDSARDALCDLAYSTRTIPKQLYVHLKKTVPHYIFPKRGGQDHTQNTEVEMARVRLSEWVSVYSDKTYQTH